MTVEKLEYHYLTPGFWIRRFVLPTATLLIIVLLLYGWLLKGRTGLDEVAALAGFFAFYFLAVRGGHIYMIRTVHNQLKSDFAARYPESLQSLPEHMKIRQIGFALAKIKADLHRQNK